MGKKYKLVLKMMTACLIFGIPWGGGIAEELPKDTKTDIPKFFVPRPPLSENYPCSKCHSLMPVNKKKRKLELAHTNIILKHAEEERWCFDCHEGNKLRLTDGRIIDFDKSYNLCGQCHGTIFRDWKIGIHGKRVGMWNGEKLYYLCISCHDPHNPEFKPLKPEKPPAKPANIKLNYKN